MISFSKVLYFKILKATTTEIKRTFTIPYNPKTHQFQESDYRDITQFPKDLIADEFPSERLLDRIGWNRKYGFDIRHGLVK